MVAGLGMVGAIKVNASPVTLDQTTPLARLTGEYQPLVVAADSPIKTLDDLAAMYKADPGSVTWGGFALGSPDHLVSAMTVEAMGGDVKEMNYIVAGAGGEMLSQVLGGHITVATGGYNEFAGLIQTGELRALAISSPERLPGVDVPTFKEQGYDVELVNWRGVVTKDDVSPESLAALDAAIGQLVASEAWKTLARGARPGRHVPGRRRPSRPSSMRSSRASSKSSATSASACSRAAARRLWRSAILGREGRRASQWTQQGAAIGGRLAGRERRRSPSRSRRRRLRFAGPPAAQEVEEVATFGPDRRRPACSSGARRTSRSSARFLEAFVATLPELHVTFEAWNTNDLYGEAAADCRAGGHRRGSL